MNDTKIVVYGTIIDARLISAEDHLQISEPSTYYVPEELAKTVIRVDKPVKGATKDQNLIVYFDVSGTSCSWYPQVGNPQVFFISETEGNNFYGMCGQGNYWDRKYRKDYIDLFEEISGEDWSLWRD